MPISRRELGSPDAPVLVLIHGLGASGRALDRVVPLLAARFRVIVPDLPGFGDTGGEHTTIEGMARAVLEALDADGVGEFVAAGHSMGGLVATALAELAPDRVTRLVLVNAPAELREPDGRARPRRADPQAARGRRPRLAAAVRMTQIRATMRRRSLPGTTSPTCSSRTSGAPRSRRSPARAARSTTT